jgi:hypothetical protein
MSATNPPARRVRRAEDRIECPDQDEGTWVLLILGQSNAANYHGQRHSSEHGEQVVNFFDGRCYIAESPLLGTSGSQGESWTLLGNELVAAGVARRVVLVPAAIASSSVSRWQEGGDLNAMLGEVLGHLSPRYRVTHVLWHQGEADYIDGTEGSDYRRMFLSLVASLRARGVAAPVFASVATRCGIRPDWTEANPLAEAQRSLPGSGARHPRRRGYGPVARLRGPARRLPLFGLGRREGRRCVARHPRGARPEAGPTVNPLDASPA